MTRRLMVLAFVFVGCARHEGMLDYINNPANHILQKIKIADVSISSKLLPPAYSQLMASGIGNSYTDSAQENQFYYFDVQIEKLKGEKLTKEKLLYLDFDIAQDFTLVQGNRKSMPSICQKIENGKGGSYEYLIAFEKPLAENKQNLDLVYVDKIFGVGAVGFAYAQKDIRKIPRLNSED
jgi:hypothetical protein